MARFLQGLFAKPQTSPPATSLRVSTSLQGIPIALLLGGQARMAVNLIDNFGFAFTPASGTGGKGGVFGAGAKGQQQATYTVSFIAGVCAGPIAGFINDWQNGSKAGMNPFPTAFAGDYTQQPWGYAQAQEPARALAYRGLAYIAEANYALGASPSLPQINVEVLSLNSGNIVPGQPDGDPTIAVNDFLTNSQYGVGFPAARLASWAGYPSSWQSYCKALGFGVSPALASQVQSSAFVNDICEATNSAPCWQNGQFAVVPRGDQAVSQGALTQIGETHIVPKADANGNVKITVGNVGNFVSDGGVSYYGGGAFAATTSFPPAAAGTYYQSGGSYWFNAADIGQTVTITYTYAAAASYVPDTVDLYDFTVDDFLVNQGTIGTGQGAGSSPVLIVRKPRDQMLNLVKVEYLDRNTDYNPVDIEVKDSASIVQFKRVRPSEVKQFHFFCLASAAVQSAALKLQREQIARTFQWTCGKHFMLILQLMKIVTLTVPNMGLNRQPVRIIEMQENSDESLTITAEEFPGTASAPLYGTQAGLGQLLNYNADPGALNTPLVVEPTDELARALIPGGGLMIAVAVSGASPLWGGAQVWLSYDGQLYQQVGTITSPARMGTLSAPLPSVIVNQVGQTIDQANTLSVDLTESNGALSSGTQLDATSLNTACIIGPLLGQPGAGAGEIVAYQTATLTSKNKYNLTYLVRGAYGTEAEIATWSAGTGFARIDGNIFIFPFDKTRIGSTVFFKFAGFNIYRGGVQSLGSVQPYTYTIQGSALASPLPTLTNVRTVFVSNRLGVSWDEISDFRGAIRVEVRLGQSFGTALILGTVAHPPYILPGNGTYWFSAWCQPASGLIVRSETPVSVAASGVTLTSNLVASFDCKANGWPGTFSNTSVDATVNAVRVNLSVMPTTAPTPAGGNVLNFALVPNQVLPGISVTDTTDTVIPAGTTVVSTTQTTVTISNPVQADFWAGDFPPADFGSRGVLTGDVIQFGTSHVLDPAGTYSPAFAVNVGRPVNCTITISLQGSGVQVGQNILAEPDVLGMPDVLGSTSTQYVDVSAKVLVSQDGITYVPVKYTPGDFFGMAFKFEFDLSTISPDTIPYLLAATISVQVPARIDHILTNAPLSAAGLAVQFTPDGSATPASFNGGPNGATVPHILATWGDEQPGDVFSITGLTLSGATFQIVNGGVGVTRNHVNILAEGF